MYPKHPEGFPEAMRLNGSYNGRGEKHQKGSLEALRLKGSPKKRWEKKVVETNNLERSVPEPVNAVNDTKFMDITVDSGAADNVMLEHMAPGIPLEHSDEQAAGVVYSAANGDLMPNRGKKSVPIITKEGSQER